MADGIGATGVTPLGHEVFQIDTRMAGYEGITAGYLIRGDRPCLVETGTAPSAPVVRDALASLGIGAGDLATVVVTHIHLDHAGGAGDIAAMFPAAQIVVHQRGARHLADPSKLMAGARMVYGRALERLFGVLAPVPAERIVALDDTGTIDLGGDRRLDSHYSPGHAKHHVGLVDSDTGDLYVGDAAGVYLPDTGDVRPADAAARLRSGDGTGLAAQVRRAAAVPADVQPLRPGRPGERDAGPVGGGDQHLGGANPAGPRGGPGPRPRRRHGPRPHQGPVRGSQPGRRSRARGQIRAGQQRPRQRGRHHALARQDRALRAPSRCVPHPASASPPPAHPVAAAFMLFRSPGERHGTRLGPWPLALGPWPLAATVLPGQLAAAAGARRRDTSGLQSLWHHPYQIIRRGCLSHAAAATWLRHSRRIRGA